MSLNPMDKIKEIKESFENDVLGGMPGEDVVEDF